VSSPDDLAELREAVSNWGRWGSDDELGTLNLISPAARARAAASVTDGRVVSLGRRLKLGNDPDTPQSVHAVWRRAGEYGAAAEFVGLAFHGQSITHIDALSHVHYKSKMYNGFAAEEISQFGAPWLNVESIAEAVSGRGVLLDIPALHGVDSLDRDAVVTPEELDAAAERQELEIEEGDLVFVRTGTPYTSYAEGSPGLHSSCLRWLHTRGASALGSDVGNDTAPGDLAIHRIGIPSMGLTLVDNCDLTRLSAVARDLRRYAFLVVVAPARAIGATGWPVNPLALF
jgi:kynurenine formamidase